MAPNVYSISPSQQFRGNDGNWSTFAIQVGNPPTTVEVLPATSGRSVWVVNPEFCSAAGEQGPSDGCSMSRGLLFDPNKSTTWKNLSNVADTYYGLNFGPEASLNSLLPRGLNYSGAAIPGTDHLAFGIDTNSDAPALDHQFIASYINVVPFVGVIGLSDVNETIVTSADTHYSVVGALKAAGHISRAYYGYTAGASYRDDSTVYNLGSLTFGGYDASRGNVNDVLTVPMNQADTNRAMTVALQTMSLGDGDQTMNVNLGIPTLIDSVVPEIWLPESGYSAIETQFGLTFDNVTQLYLVDDQKHDDLARRNVSITFSLSAGSGSSDTLDITLPYSALQPVAGWPIFDRNNTNASMRYFPVRRATSGDRDQFYLGRTFLQEAYIAADYDQQEFYLSRATFRAANADEDLKSVGSSGSGLSVGAIVGIVIGVVAALAIIGALLWRFCFRKRTQRSTTGRKSAGSSTIGGTTLEIEQWNDGVQEPEPKEHVLVEHYRPDLTPQELSGHADDHPKPELDATRTERGNGRYRSRREGRLVSRFSDQSTGFTSIHRHELSAGTIRRTSDQSRTSLAQSGIVSPMDERARAGARYTLNDSIGMPSPPSGHPVAGQRFGTPSPQLSDSQASPPLSSGMSWHSGPVPAMYELPDTSREESLAALSTSTAADQAERPMNDDEAHRPEDWASLDSGSRTALPHSRPMAQLADMDPSAYYESMMHQAQQRHGG